MKIPVELAVERWKSGAIEEVQTARYLLDGDKKREALFWAHLALEKALKAHVVQTTRKHAPFTHSLPMLIKLAKLELSTEQTVAAEELDAFQIEARYESMDTIEFITVDMDFAQHLITEMEELVGWLIRRL